MSDSASSIERLYEIMKTIEENKKNGKATENVPLFTEILSCTKGDSMSKRLASQFIARLFKDFPDEQAAAYEAMVDLIEDGDVVIRKQVISDLPKLCKDVPIYVPKVTDLLVQMMQTDDSQEQSLVNQALMQALTAHPTEALTGLFDQLTHDEAADLTRERALRFLTAKLPHLSLTPEREELLVQLADRLLDDVTEEEFASVVQLLASLRCMHGQVGRQRLVDIVCQQADLAAAFAPTDPPAVARAHECAKQAAALMGRSANAKALLVYYLDKVLPVIDQVPDEAAGEPPSHAVSPRLELLRALAELSWNAGSSFVATDKQLSLLLARLTDLMPLPPTPPSTPAKDSSGGDGDASPTKPEEGEIEAPSEANLNFSQVECLLFTFHRLVRTNPEFLVAYPEGRLADFNRRLKFFDQANQIYLRSLRSLARASPPVAPTKKQPEGEVAPAEPPAADQDPSAPQLRQAALAATNNISQLIRDLLRSPPVFRAEVQSLSWQQGDRDRDRQLESLPSLLDQRKRHVGGSADNGGGASLKRRIDLGGGRSDRYGSGGGGGSRNRRGGGWRSQRW